jgi:hypothetical protein
METPLKLALSLARRDANNFTVELSVSDPGAQVSPAPERGVAPLNPDQLLKAALDPLAYGKQLFKSLFKAENVLRLFDEARAVAQMGSRPLGLRLFIFPDAAELHRLRWETLFDERPGGGWLLTNERVHFARFLGSASWEAAEPRPGASPRPLVVIANPADLASGIFMAGGKPLAPVDVAKETRRASEGLGLLLRDEDCLVSDPNRPGQVTLANLCLRLRAGFEILYLVCHGSLNSKDERSPSQLLLEKPDGSGEVVSGADLVDQVQALSPELRPRLVVLASCQSAGTGGEEATADALGALAGLGPQLALAGVPAVLAMQGSISMTTVAGFMPLFFKELLKDGQAGCRPRRATA